MSRKKVERGKTYTQEFVDNFQSEKPPVSKNFKNLVGYTFGDLIVIKYIGRSPPHSYWFCQCDCGRIERHSTNVLNRGKQQCHHCGMKILSEKLTIPKETAIREIKELHPTYQLLDFDKCQWFCTKCNSEFRLPLKSYRSGRLSCYCNKTKPISEETNITRVLEVCEDKGYEYLGYDGEYLGNKTYIKLSCGCCGNKWSSNINNFKRGYGCEPCSKKRAGDKNRHDPSIIITGGLRVHGNKFNYDNFKYIDSRTPSEIFCNTCHKPFKQSYDNHVNKGKGCPTCSVGGYSSALKGNFYIQMVGIDYIKFGITNRNPYKRMEEHQEKSKLQHRLIATFQHQNGEIARQVENIIKRKRYSDGLSREIVPDGFSETCSMSHFREIFDIASQHFRGNH